MTEMAPEQPLEIEATGDFSPEGGLTASAELPGAKITLSVTKETFETNAGWTELVVSFPQTVNEVLLALRKAQEADEDQVDIDA